MHPCGPSSFVSGTDGVEPVSLVERIEARHADLSARAEALSLVSGLACPSGCGRCCISPNVESSVADLLPAAHALFARGDAAAVHALAAASPGWTRCVLYQPDAARPDVDGRCGLYEHRPSICRVFGFAARRAKASEGLELATCKDLRRFTPETVARAEAVIAAGFDAPRVDRAPAEIGAELGGGAAPLPINEALRRAIERLGIERALLAGGRRGGDEDDEPDRPLPPLRAA